MYWFRRYQDLDRLHQLSILFDSTNACFQARNPRSRSACRRIPAQVIGSRLRFGRVNGSEQLYSIRMADTLHARYALANLHRRCFGRYPYTATENHAMSKDTSFDIGDHFQSFVDYR